jgi:virulence-associated protein VagC
VNYKFIFSTPKGEEIETKMEDRLVLSRVKDKWKITKLTGSLAKSDFLDQAIPDSQEQIDD